MSTDAGDIGKARALGPHRAGLVVAVTGACSTNGRQLLCRLERDPRCRRMLAIDIRKPPLPLAKMVFHKVDLSLPGAGADLAAILGGGGGREPVDVLVHAAFLSTPTHNYAWAHEVESVGTMHVLNAVGRAGVRKLVMASTTLVYGAHPKNPNYLTEDSPRRANARSRFVKDKADAEDQVFRFAEEHPERVVTVLRIAATLGRAARNFATRFFERPVCPVLMGYDPLLQLVHEEDVGEALSLAVTGDHPGIYNIAGRGVLPYSTVLALLGRVPLPMPRVLAYSLSQALWATQIFDSPPEFLDFLRYLCVADGGKAERELGFVPRYDIQATIADFLGLAPAARRDETAEGSVYAQADSD